MPTTSKFWAGTAESYNAVVAGMARAQEIASSGDTSEYSLPAIWSKQEGVAIIEVSGSLVTGSSSWGRFFGVLGYDDIREAVVAAINDVEVKSILLHVSSGGGSVAGADDLGKFIAKANKLKPIVAYTDSVMASAAYWIACGASEIHCSSTAILGSLGILSVHIERSKAMLEMGITATVMRVGKYKALTNSLEPLTPEAMAESMDQMTDMYDIFISHVATSRKVTTAVADQQMGQGREFLGKKAVSAGLADKVTTYEQVFASCKKLDKSASIGNNPSNFKGAIMAKATLSEQQQAAIAAGADISTVTTPAPAAEVTTPNTSAVADTVTPATPTTPAAAPEVITATLESTDNAVVAMLQAQLATANTDVINARVELATLKSQTEATKASYDGLLAIGRESIGKMAIALGQSASISAGYDAATVITQYTATKAVFNEKFKVGGVAATAQATAKDEAQVSPLEAAMIQAANVN